ncbi:Uncharacterised protein [Clostridioides difficile]|nr:Uncharacterised protein [Clostridioides difficile]
MQKFKEVAIIINLIINILTIILIGIWIVVDYKRYKVEKENCEVYKSLEDKVIGMHTEVVWMKKVQEVHIIDM